MWTPWTKAIKRALHRCSEADELVRADVEALAERYGDRASVSVTVGIRAELDGLSAQVDLHRTNTESVLDHLNEAVQALQQRNNDLVLAISDGIERTDRAERRVKASIRRARQELKSRGYVDPGLEAEAHEFRDIDGDGSGESQLPVVSGGLEESGPRPSSIEGVPLDVLKRVRGV